MTEELKIVMTEELKIEHDRPGCIGCGACAAVAPQFWTMSPVDGKSDLINSNKIEEDGEIVAEEMKIKNEDKEANMVAAESCPVNVIHIRNMLEDKRII